MYLLIFIGTLYVIKSTAFSSFTDHNNPYKDGTRGKREDPKLAPVSLKRLCAKKFIGRYADVKSCSVYYECTAGKLYKKTCPTGEWFDNEKLLCSAFKTVKCQRKREEENLIKESLKLICANTLIGTYADVHSCYKYYECSAGKLHLKICPTGEMFDFENTVCLPSRAVNCLIGRPNLKVSKHKPTAEEPEEKYEYTEYLRLVCAKKFIGKYIDVDSCDKYYECSGGKLYEKTCPDGELFDNETVGCKPFKTVDCHVGRTKPTNEMTEEEKALHLRSEELKISCAKKFIGRFEDVDSCSDYYECAAGKLYKKTCPTGEWFDNETLVCSAFETVKCERVRDEKNQTEVCTSNISILTNNFGATYEHRLRKYEISKDFYDDYHDSEKTCRDICGHLADVGDKEEENFVLDVLQLNDLECVLIAGHDLNKNEIYLNEATQERLQYINWAKGELKRKNTNNHCLSIRNGQTGMFKSPCTKDTLNCNVMCKIRI